MGMLCDILLLYFTNVAATYYRHMLYMAQTLGLANRHHSPVNIVAEKKVVGMWRIAAAVKVAQQVFKLSVNVSADVDRSIELQQHRLLQEDVARSLA